LHRVCKDLALTFFCKFGIADVLTLLLRLSTSHSPKSALAFFPKGSVGRDLIVALPVPPPPSL